MVQLARPGLAGAEDREDLVVVGLEAGPCVEGRADHLGDVPIDEPEHVAGGTVQVDERARAAVGDAHEVAGGLDDLGQATVLLLGRDQLGDVLDRADDPGDPTVLVHGGHALVGEPVDEAMGVDDAVLVPEDPAVADHVEQALGHPVVVVGVHRRHGLLIGGRRRRHAGDLAPLGVDVGDAAVGVGLVDPDGDRFGEGAEAGLALGQRVDSQTSVGHVLHHRVQEQLAVLVGEGGAAAHPHGPPVGADEAPLALDRVDLAVEQVDHLVAVGEGVSRVEQRAWRSGHQLGGRRPHHVGEGLVDLEELTRQRAEHLPDGGLVDQPAIAGLAATQGLFSRLALGDVEGEGEVGHGLAGGVALEGRGARHPDDAAVLVQQAPLAFERVLRARHELAGERDRGLPIVGMDELEGVGPDQLLGGATHQCGVGPVDLQHRSVDRADGLADRSLGDQVAEPLVGPLLGLGQLEQVGQVEGGAHIARQLAVLVEVRGTLGQHVADLAVGADDPRLVLEVLELASRGDVGLGQRLAVVGVDQVLEDLVGDGDRVFDPGDLPPAPVGEEHGAVRAGRDDADWRRLRHLAERIGSRYGVAGELGGGLEVAHSDTYPIGRSASECKSAFGASPVGIRVEGLLLST